MGGNADDSTRIESNSLVLRLLVYSSYMRLSTLKTLGRNTARKIRGREEILTTRLIGVRTVGVGEGESAAPPKFWATQIYWVNLGKSSF